MAQGVGLRRRTREFEGDGSLRFLRSKSGLSDRTAFACNRVGRSRSFKALRRLCTTVENDHDSRRNDVIPRRPSADLSACFSSPTSAPVVQTLAKMQAAPRLARNALRQAPRAAPSSHQSSPTATFCVASTLPRSSFASYPTPAAHLSFPTSHVRGFASSARSEAKEPPSNPFDGPQMLEHAPLFERIKEVPEVLDAIESALRCPQTRRVRADPVFVLARAELARLTHEKTGVDLAGGHKPSMSMMLQLARCVQRSPRRCSD